MAAGEESGPSLPIYSGPRLMGEGEQEELDSTQPPGEEEGGEEPPPSLLLLQLPVPLLQEGLSSSCSSGCSCCSNPPPVVGEVARRGQGGSPRRGWPRPWPISGPGGSRRPPSRWGIASCCLMSDPPSRAW